MNARRKRIVKLLEERGEVAVGDLLQELSVSEATVRRDLAVLDDSGVLTRTFGGARLRETPSLVVQTLEQKLRVMRAEKERIARRAAQLVEPGMSVGLDSGSTTWRVAAALKEKAPLDIVTNALPAIEELGAVEGIQINCVGGRFRRSNLDFMGNEAAQALRALHVNIAFMGIDSLIPGRGVYTDSQEDAQSHKVLGEIADTCVAVADHTKVNTRGVFLGLRADQIDCLIMDGGLDDETRALLEADPYDLVITE
jgi:DeoR/GlpR family transcriptional regulator of sugar metabolism